MEGGLREMETGLQLLDLVAQQQKARKREANRRAAWALEDLRGKKSALGGGGFDVGKGRGADPTRLSRFRGASSALDCTEDTEEADERGPVQLPTRPVDDGGHGMLYFERQLCLSDLIAERSSKLRHRAQQRTLVQLPAPPADWSDPFQHKVCGNVKTDVQIPDWVRARLAP